MDRHVASHFEEIVTLIEGSVEFPWMYALKHCLEQARCAPWVEYSRSQGHHSLNNTASDLAAGISEPPWVWRRTSPYHQGLQLECPFPEPGT
jgi:hypothetical protein